MFYRKIIPFKNACSDKCAIHIFFGLFLLFLYSCTSYRPSYPEINAARSARFYTPRSWQTPMTKGKSGNISQKNNTVSKNYDFTNRINPIPIPNNPQPNDGFNNRTGNIPQPKEQMDGVASWYGPNFHGSKTANGEIYNQYDMTAAHKFLPLNSIVRVRNKQNGLETVVRINDRGPYVDNRIIDLSRAAAEKIDMVNQGTTPVKLEIIQYPKNFDKKAGIEAYKQAVIQLAVFKNRSNAGYYKDELSRKYNNLRFFIDSPKYQSFHVVIGPFNDRKKAEGISKDLRYDGHKTLVRSYRK